MGESHREENLGEAKLAAVDAVLLAPSLRVQPGRAVNDLDRDALAFEVVSVPRV
jgi:hypothetical protein